MKLSDRDIKKNLDSGIIKINPEISDSQIGPTSIDLRLGNEFSRFKRGEIFFIDLSVNATEHAMTGDLMTTTRIEDGGRFILHPHELALAITHERVTIPNTMELSLNGRSSLGRIGLVIHLTADCIEPGWDGKITLELVNFGPYPIVLQPGMRICAIGFQMLSSPAERSDDKRVTSKYTKQDKPLASRIKDDHIYSK